MSKFVLTAQLQLQAPTNVGQVAKQIQKQLSNVTVNVQAKGAAQTTRQVKDLTKAVQQADSAAFKLGKTFTTSLKRFAAFSVATRAVSLFTQGIGGALDEAIKFERELIKVAQVTGKTVSELSNLTDEIRRLSTSLGVSSAELLNVSRALSQAGFSARETKVALDALAKSSLAPTFEDMAKTAEGAIAIFNQFGKGAAALEAQLGAINAVAGQFAVEAGDLISVIRRTGGVFKAAGGDLNELIALFTSVRATTRESAESIATGLRTIFTRIQRPRTIKFLEGLGVSLVDLEGKFVGPFEAIKRLSEALGGLEAGDLRFVRIAEELGGFRQIGKVIPLLNQFGIAQEAYNTALGGANSLTKDAETAQGSLAVQLQKLREQWLATVRSITESTGFKIAVEAALSLASAVLSIADSLKAVLPLLAAFGAMKIAKGFGGFLAGAKSGGLAAVPKFASGGMVPGSGSRDTVPAMLTPGEFVIRKSSVQKLGAENLKQMNAKGYASGGTVSLKDNTTGAFFLRAKSDKDSGATEFTPNVPKLSDKTLVTNEQAQIAMGYDPKKVADFSKKGVDALLDAELGEGKGEELHRQARTVADRGGKLIENKGSAWNTDALNTVLNEQGVNKDQRASIIQQVETGKVVGVQPKIKSGTMKAMFLGGGDSPVSEALFTATRDAATKALSDGVEEIASNENIANFLKPIGNAIKPSKTALDDAMAEISNPKGGASESVQGYLLEGITGAMTGASIAGGQTRFDFPDVSQVQDRMKELYAGDFSEMKAADAKRTLDGKSKESVFKKAYSTLRQPGDDWMNFWNVSQNGMNKGGSVTDTVPAMLTPGEFVVSKKAAQSIGPANLDRMNKKGVQGFAKGGPVGRVQKFANGGDVRESALGGYDMVKPFIALSAVLPAMQAGFEGLNGASQELEEGFNAAKVGANAGLGAATMMAMALDIAAKNMEKQKQKREKEGDAIDDVTSEAEVLKSALAESTKAIEEQKVALEEAEKSLGEAEVTELSVDADSISVASIDSFILQNELSIQAQSVVLHGDRVSDAAGADAASARAANPASVAEIQNLEQSTAFSEQRLKDIGRPLTKDKGTLIGSSFSRTEGIKEKIKQEEKRLNRKNVSDTTRADAEANIKALNQQLEEEKQVRRDLRSEMQQHRETIVENKSKIEDLKAAQEEAAQAAADAAKQAEAAAQAVDLFGDAAEDITLAPLNEDLVNKNVAATNPAAVAKAEADAIIAQARAADTKASIDPDDAPTPRMFFKGRAERNAATFRERRERVIAEGDALSAEFDKKIPREERFDKALEKRQQITQDLRAKRDATPKGDLPERKRLQKEINKSIAAEKAIIKKKKEITKELDGLHNDYVMKQKEVEQLNKSIRKGGKTLALRFSDLAKKIKNATRNITGGRRGFRGALAAGGSALRGAGRLGMRMAPAAAGLATSAFAMVQDYQSQQFEKALSSGDPADLATARGMVEGNVDMEMMSSRLSDTLAGAASGAAIGSFFGPIGTAIGGALGGAGGFFKDEIMHALGIGPSREEKRQKAINEKQARIAETNLDKNILPSLQKSFEKFQSTGSEQQFDNIMTDFDSAREEIKTIAKHDKERAGEREKQLEGQAKVLAGSIGSSAASQAELNKRILELSKKFPELAEELESTAKSAFILAEANKAQIKMQADILKVSSAFRAASLGVGNFLDSLQTGANSWNQTVNTLREAQQNIALGENAGAAVQEARDRVRQQFVASGAGDSEAAAAADRQFDLLEQASEFSSNLPTVLANTTFDRGGTDEAIKSDITEALLGAAGVTADSELGKVIAGRAESLTPEQLAALRNGTLDLSQVFSDLQGQVAKLGSGALAAAEAMQAHENTIIKLTAARIKAEQNLIATQKQAVDLQLEAAQIAAKFGGTAVTAEQRRNAAIEKFNLTAGRLGAGALTTGTGADIRNASGNLAGQFASLEMRANRPGGFGGAAGLDADKRNEIIRAQAELVGVTKALIEADKQELDILKKKNALERESLDKLIGGDTEGFFQGMAAQAATSLIASGDASGLSGDVLAQALENIRKQREAGVTEIDGIDIRTVEQRAAQAALGARGVTDPRAAAMVAGQTREQEEIEARIRERAGALGAIGENMVDMAQMQVQTAEMTINQANIKFREGLAEASSNIEGAAGFARGGVVYASRGMFIPRGTDTVPAMLTPGEFVVNRASVNRGNNLQILRAINNGSQAAAPAAGSAATMNQGGQVGYYNNGGSVVGGMDASILEGLNAFNTAFAQNIANLQNTRFQIKLDTTNVNVNLNGGSFLNSMKEEVKSELLAEVGNQISNLKFNAAGEAKVSNKVIES